MFKLKQSGPERGDCTAPYLVELDRDYTVSEFVEAVLTIKDEWGYIGIFNKNILLTGQLFGEPNCKYSYGTLRTELPDYILRKKVISVKASGGWSRMDYLLEIEQPPKTLIEMLVDLTRNGFEVRFEHDRENFEKFGGQEETISVTVINTNVFPNKYYRTKLLNETFLNKEDVIIDILARMREEMV